jgi:hypothetical protein
MTFADLCFFLKEIENQMYFINLWKTEISKECWGSHSLGVGNLTLGHGFQNLKKKEKKPNSNI